MCPVCRRQRTHRLLSLAAAVVQRYLWCAFRSGPDPGGQSLKAARKQVSTTDVEAGCLRGRGRPRSWRTSGGPCEVREAVRHAGTAMQGCAARSNGSSSSGGSGAAVPARNLQPARGGICSQRPARRGGTRCCARMLRVACASPGTRRQRCRTTECSCRLEWIQSAQLMAAWSGRECSTGTAASGGGCGGSISGAGARCRGTCKRVTLFPYNLELAVERGTIAIRSCAAAQHRSSSRPA